MIKAEWTNKDSLDLQPTCNQLATTEGDLINRADAINCIKWGEGVTDVIERIESLPSADRPTGEWNDLNVVSISRAGVDELQEYRCSNCDRWLTTPYMYYPRKYNYCPWCGADMRGDKHGD